MALGSGPTCCERAFRARSPPLAFDPAKAAMGLRQRDSAIYQPLAQRSLEKDPETPAIRPQGSTELSGLAAERMRPGADTSAS